MKLAIFMTGALLVGCLDDVIPGTKPPCMENAERSMSIALPTDAQTQFQLNQCQADADACNPLCALLLMRDQITGNAVGCDVKFGDTKIDVTVHYQVMRADADNCPVTDGSGSGDVFPPNVGGPK